MAITIEDYATIINKTIKITRSPNCEYSANLVNSHNGYSCEISENGMLTSRGTRGQTPEKALLVLAEYISGKKIKFPEDSYNIPFQYFNVPELELKPVTKKEED